MAKKAALEPRESAIRDLVRIPHVGRKTAEALYNIGVKSCEDMKRQDPEELYMKLLGQPGIAVDRIMLYVMRCAVYYITHDVHDPELLKWWNWKEGAKGHPLP